MTTGSDTTGEHAAESGAEDFVLEDALKRLEEIAQQLEGQSPELERGLELYREARALYERCVKTLSAAEKEIRVLMADGTVTEGLSTPELDEE